MEINMLYASLGYIYTVLIYFLVEYICSFISCQAISYSCSSCWGWAARRYFWNNISLWELDAARLWCYRCCFWRSWSSKRGSTDVLYAKQV